jgi:hypothetical protein
VDVRPAEHLGMTSVSSTSWLPGALARPPAVGAARPRHLASESDPTMEYRTAVAEAARTGRHAEPEWARGLFDPQRDDDPFEWLGFTDSPN